MAAPPLLADAVHDTVDVVFWYEVAVTLVGTAGVVAGVVDADAVDAGPVPAPLVAFTVNV